MFTLALIMLVIAVPLITIPIDIKKGSLSPYVVVLKSIVTTMIGSLIIIALASITGNGIFQAYHGVIQEVSKTIVADDSLREMVGLTDVADNEAVNTLTAYYDYFVFRIPSYIILVSTVLSYFTYLISSRSRARTIARLSAKGRPIHGSSQVKLMPRLREFSFPSSTLTSMVIMYIIAFLMYRTEVDGGLAIYYNITYVFNLVFCIQAAAVIFMFCDFKKWPRIIPIIVLIIFWNVYFLREFMVVMGMVDLIFNLRAIIVARSQQGGRNKRDNKRR